jgi:hypothetical protein
VLVVRSCLFDNSLQLLYEAAAEHIPLHSLQDVQEHTGLSLAGTVASSAVLPLRCPGSGAAQRMHAQDCWLGTD